jgi:7-keto-8-aminopelargonate synthetase-like enzyme
MATLDQTIPCKRVTAPGEPSDMVLVQEQAYYAAISVFNEMIQKGCQVVVYDKSHHIVMVHGGRQRTPQEREHSEKELTAFEREVALLAAAERQQSSTSGASSYFDL